MATSAIAGEPAAPTPAAAARAALAIPAEAGWSSRYFSEGRDALAGDSLWTTALEFGRNSVIGTVWYGHSPEQDYRELQLSLGFNRRLGPCDLCLALTHLRFPHDGTHDNEIGATATWSGLPGGLTFTADAYYSCESEGAFAEMGVGREFPLADRLALEVAATFGVNAGYVADGHDGANHVALATGLGYALTERVTVRLQAAYSWALARDGQAPGDVLLRDFFHGGVSVGVMF